VVSGICLSPADVGKIEAIEIPKDYGGTTDYSVVLRRDKFIGSAWERFLGALGLREEAQRRPRSCGRRHRTGWSS
jgi:hypothetical protein